MIVGCLLPWVSYTTVFGGSLDRNAFQLGQDLGFSAQGLVGVVLGLVTVLLGLCRLNRARMPAWLAQSPLWPGIGAGIFLALAFPSATSSTGVFASYGVGIWVFGVGVVTALGSALILRMTDTADREGRAASRDAASTGANRASGEMLAHHLAHCDSCKQDLPCDEWDKLYDGPAAVGSAPGQLRERLRDHLSTCDRCDKDLPCVTWDELYTTYESAGGDEASTRS
jgi:hypothetical protein